MMNSLQTIAQKALSVQLPQATTASAPAQLPVVLTLDAEGHITIDNVPMSIDAAEAMVKERIAQNPNASVILQADKRSAHGQVVAIMDMLKQAGVKRLAIAAEQKRDGKSEASKASDEEEKSPIEDANSPALDAASAAPARD